MKELHTLASSVQGFPCGRTLRPEINGGRGVSAAGGILEVLTADEQLRARLDLASRLGALAVEPRDFAELFRALYDETARVMDATVFLFALYDEASQTVSVVRQIDGGVEHEGGSFPLGKGCTSEVIRTAASRLVKQWPLEAPPVRPLYGSRAGELGRTESAAG